MTHNYILQAEPGVFAINGQEASLHVGVLSDLELNPNGRFFNFVLTYLIAAAGLTPVYDEKTYPDFMKNTAGYFPGKIAAGVRTNLSQAIKYVRSGRLPQLTAEELMCCMLANTAYESIDSETESRFRGDPVFEVFYHVRNAASHGNTWHFLPKFPKHRGKWKSLTIDDSVKGSQHPIHGKKCFYGDLQPADLLHLLRDIERLVDKN
jgi:hypothetical protein